MYCDCEIPEFYEEKTVTARKAYRCCECDTKIDIGIKYHRASGKWDGDVRSYKSCTDCGAIRNLVAKKTQCCIEFGRLFEEIEEANLDLAEIKKLLKLTDKIKTKASR